MEEVEGVEDMEVKEVVDVGEVKAEKNEVKKKERMGWEVNRMEEMGRRRRDGCGEGQTDEQTNKRTDAI